MLNAEQIKEDWEKRGFSFGIWEDSPGQVWKDFVHDVDELFTTIRIQFYYRGVVCRETLKLEATPANIKYAARLRSEVMNAIERNRFNYADFFS